MNRSICLLNDSLKTDSRQQKLGALSRTYACMPLSPDRAAVTFSGMPGGSCVLELEELHSVEEAAFSYLVLVNDRVVFQRTMEPVSQSLCPCLVKLELAAGDSITLRPVGGTVYFADIFLHTQLDALQAEYWEPMQIGLCFPRPTYTDRAADLAQMRKIRDDFADLRHFTVAVGVEVKYMQCSDAQLAQQLRYILELAREVGVDLIFNFNSWWDGTPTGRDGKGGCFGDLEYQQIVYDPITGEKKLSVPNLWRDTPWYTMNHPHLNRVRKQRLRAAVELLGAQRAELGLEGGKNPDVRILIDNEPTYWAEFAYSSSPEAGGDFNEFAIAEAARDGVDLNPRGELNQSQRLWLLHNLCTYMTDVSRAYYDSTSREYGLVTDNRVEYGGHRLTENVMTHVQMCSGHPCADERHMRHEEHVNPYARLGVETCGHQDERVLSYFPATGRYAQVNAERCCYTDPAFHRQFYAHGAFTDIIFNFFYDTDLEHLHGMDDMERHYMPQSVWGSEVMRFSPFTGKLTQKCIVSAENMEIGPLRERRVLRPAKLGRGSITFDLGAVSDYPHGGWAELKGLVRPENGSICAALGTQPDVPDRAQPLQEWDADHQLIPLRLPLDGLLDRAGQQDRVYLKLIFENLYYDDWAQMNAVWEVRGVAAFERWQTHGDTRLTLPQARAMSLLIAYRTDCARLAEQYPEVVVEEAGSYAAQYRRRMQRISIQNTDKFLIRGSGYLEKYRLRVDSGGTKLGLSMRECPRGLELTLRGEPGSRLDLSSRECALTVQCLDTNRYLLKQEPSAQGGSASLKLCPEPEKQGCFVGTFLGYDAGTQCMEVCTHDPAWDYQAVLQFACGEAVPVTLQASEITGTMLEHISTNPYTPAAIVNARIDASPTVHSLRPGDMVTCRLVGERICDVRALRGLARGRIVAVEPISMEAPMHNAFVTLETAPGEHVTFELGMNTHLNYQRAHGENPVKAGAMPLELAPDNIVLITFEPETVEGRPYRALEVTMV